MGMKNLVRPDAEKLRLRQQKQITHCSTSCHLESDLHKFEKAVNQWVLNLDVRTGVQSGFKYTYSS